MRTTGLSGGYGELISADLGVRSTHWVYSGVDGVMGE